MEFGNDLACLDQGWHASFDRRDVDVSAFVSKSRPIAIWRAVALPRLNCYRMLSRCLT